MAPSEWIYRFGEFQLHPAERRLQRGEETVPLEARVLDLLLYLLEHRGRTVSRSELTRAIWGAAKVSDGSLRRTVSLLRKALDARGPSGTLVETVHGRGYRFAAAVEIEEHEWTIDATRGRPDTIGDAPLRRPLCESGYVAFETASAV